MVNNEDIVLARSWPRHWIELGISFVLGIALSFAVENPLAGALLPTVLAGWPSFSVGRWLLKTDSRRRRAWVCFLFYIAAACWKGASAAFTTAMVFFLIESHTGRAPTVEEIAATFLTMLAAVVLCTLLGLASLVLAVRYRIRVWVHPRIRRTFERFPKSVLGIDGTHHGFNQAIFVVATSVVFPLVAGGSVALIVLLADSTPNQVSVVPTLVAFAVAFAGPLAMIPVYGWLSSRIIARHPSECWGATWVEDPGPGAV